MFDADLQISRRCRNNREEQVMEFRPCIDIHNGKVKQIVGGSLRDGRENAARFSSDKGAAEAAPCS